MSTSSPDPVLADPVLAAWDVPTQRAPEALTPNGRLRAAVRWAVLAPSGHNSQPWRFVVRDEALELRADRSRRLPLADPDDRELAIACGAALMNARLALRHLGDEPVVQLLPEPGDRDLLARVTLGAPAVDAAADAALFVAIGHRRTNRAAYEPRDIPGDLLVQLVREVAAEGAWLQLLTEQAQRWELGSLVEEADRVQYADPAFRRELASWIRTNHEAPDGIRAYGLGMSDTRALGHRFAVRLLDIGRSRGARDRSLVEEAPVAVVLGTDGDSPADWLRAGQALQRMLLRARSESVWAAFHNQPVQVRPLRTRLATTIGRQGHPQVVLRLGYGPAPRPEPRRPAEDVLSETV